MGMILLSAEESKKNTFEGNKWMFLSKLDEKAWREFFNQKVETEASLESYKEELYHGGKVRGTSSGGHRTGRKGEKGVHGRHDQAARNRAEDQR